MMCVRVRAKNIFCYVQMCVLAQRSTITALLKNILMFRPFLDSSEEYTLILQVISGFFNNPAESRSESRIPHLENKQDPVSR